MIEVKDIKKLPQFVFGSFGQRFAAYIVDSLLINAISSLSLNIYNFLGFYDSEISFGLFGLTGLLIYFAYFILFTKFTNGQTIGKMILGLRVVSLDNENLSWGDVLTRELIGRFIQKKIIILYLLVFVTKRKETMSDLFADTVVISEGAYLDLKELLKDE